MYDKAWSIVRLFPPLSHFVILSFFPYSLFSSYFFWFLSDSALFSVRSPPQGHMVFVKFPECSFFITVCHFFFYQVYDRKMAALQKDGTHQSILIIFTRLVIISFLTTEITKILSNDNHHYLA